MFETLGVIELSVGGGSSLMVFYVKISIVRINLKFGTVVKKEYFFIKYMFLRKKTVCGRSFYKLKIKLIHAKKVGYFY